MKTISLIVGYFDYSWDPMHLDCPDEMLQNTESQWKEQLIRERVVSRDSVAFVRFMSEDEKKDLEVRD